MAAVFGPAKTVLSMAGIALVTALVFAGTLGHGFVWDDDQNLVDNPHYRGFGRAQVAWMLRLVPADHPGRDDQWIPLSWASLALDHLLWDMNPAGLPTRSSSNVTDASSSRSIVPTIRTG